MAVFERNHISKLVPANLRVLSPLLLAVAIVSSATLGYDASVMNGLLILPSYSDYFYLTTATEGLKDASSWMGGIIGAFLMQIILDYFGRRQAILIVSVIVVNFLFQGFYAFAITPMTSLYPTAVSPFKLRATGIAVFRMLDSGFGSVNLLINCLAWKVDALLIHGCESNRSTGR